MEKIMVSKNISDEKNGSDDIQKESDIDSNLFENINLDNLSDEDIKKMRGCLDEKLKYREALQKLHEIDDNLREIVEKGLPDNEILKYIRHKLKEFSNLRPKTELDDSKPKKTINPKYKLDEQTWAGRGKKPHWLKEQLSKGKKLEDFEIK